MTAITPRTSRRTAVINGSADRESIRQTGPRAIWIDENTKTFIWTAHTESLNLSVVTWLTNSDEIIYASESNGWRHFTW